MGWTLGLGVYFVIWWTSLFAVLPFGIKSQREAGDVVPGTEPSAPVRPWLLRRFLANTILAAALWLIVDILYIRFYLPH